MKTYLMFGENCTEETSVPCSTPVALKSDLELERILEHMAKGDKVIYDACEKALFSPLQSLETIDYRQQVLTDVLQNPDTIRLLYSIIADIEGIPRTFSSP